MGDRQRLRPWLEARISSGEIPGLEWMDREQMIFKIPWKHGGKQEWDPKDSVIFKEWAIQTGRFREGIDRPEYATWKTRLRCAFNKANDIQEMKEMNQTESEHPYKVYKLLPKQEKHPAKKEFSYNQPMHCNQYYSPGIVVPSTVAEKGETSCESFDRIDTNDLIYPNQGTEEMDFVFTQHQNIIQDEQTFSTVPDTGAPCQVYTHIPHIEVPVPNGMTVPGPIQSLDRDPRGHEFFVKVHYLATEVGEFYVQNEHGCRLYYGSSSTEVAKLVPDKQEEWYGPTKAEQIHLPSCTSLIPNLSYESLAANLLNNLERGFVLCSSNGDIYAMRYCRARVFFHNPASEDQPTLLQRFKPTKIFDFTQFHEAFVNYYQGKQTHKPPIHVNIGIGQKWDSKQNLDKIMISAFVISANALHIKQKFEDHFGVGRSMEPLEISKSTESDQLITTMKNFIQKLAIQPPGQTCQRNVIPNVMMQMNSTSTNESQMKQE